MVKEVVVPCIDGDLQLATPVVLKLEVASDEVPVIVNELHDLALGFELERLVSPGFRVESVFEEATFELMHTGR